MRPVPTDLHVPEPSGPLYEPEPELHLGEYLRILRRRWKLIAVAAAVGLFVALVHFFVSPREYRARTTLQIERQNTLSVVTENLVQLGGSDASASTYYQTQYELLRSRGLGEVVVDMLELARDQSFNPQLVTVEQPVPGAAADEELRARLADRLLSDLEVQPVRNTYLVRLSYTADSPQLAARIVNGVADAYIEWGIQARTETAAMASEFLGSQINTIKAEIRDKELKLQTFTRTSDIVAPGGNTSPIFQRLEALNTDYIQAVSNRIDREARYNEILSAPRESTADTLSNGLVGQLKRELIALEQDYASKLNTYKPDWPAMVELRAQIEDARQHTESVVSETFDQARSQARAEYQTALRREQSIARELESLKESALDQNSAALEYDNLAIEISTRRTLLDELMRKQSETEVASSLNVSRDTNVRVVDRAIVPRSPYRPSLRRDVSMGLGLGFLLGVGLVFGVEYLDRTVKSPEELERLLGVPVLAVVPAMDAAGSYGYGGNKRSGGRKMIQRRTPSEAPVRVELVPHRKPRLAVSESYRSLRTALLLSSARTLHTVSVTSANAAEGKTVTATNLAIVMAQLGRQVLVIDADLRKPRVHKVFRIPNRKGLVTYLTGGCEPSEIFARTEIPNLYVTPSGPVPPNPSELLSSERLDELMVSARTRFDFVIFDTPPSLAVTDATLIGARTDGTVICLRAGKVLREEAIGCLDRLLLSDVKVLGAVLNGLVPSGRRYGGYYYAYEQAPQPGSSSVA